MTCKLYDRKQTPPLDAPPSGGSLRRTLTLPRGDWVPGLGPERRAWGSQRPAQLPVLRALLLPLLLLSTAANATEVVVSAEFGEIQTETFSSGQPGKLGSFRVDDEPYRVNLKVQLNDVSSQEELRLVVRGRREVLEERTLPVDYQGFYDVVLDEGRLRIAFTDDQPDVEVVPDVALTTPQAERMIAVLESIEPGDHAALLAQARDAHARRDLSETWEFLNEAFESTKGHHGARFATSVRVRARRGSPGAEVWFSPPESSKKFRFPQVTSGEAEPWTATEEMNWGDWCFWLRRRGRDVSEPVCIIVDERPNPQPIDLEERSVP
jgi:hypothetical protein